MAHRKQRRRRDPRSSSLYRCLPLGFSWARAIGHVAYPSRDQYRFRARRLPGIIPNDPVCKLCMGGIEDPAHFIAHCPALSQARELLLQELATDVATYYRSDRERFISIILGVEWIEDSDLQCSIIDKLRLLRNQILIPV